MSDYHTLYEKGDGVEAAKYIDVPEWVEQDIDCATIAATIEGGCASGAYMPAVTYHSALETMREHGGDVMQYIEDTLGEIPTPDEPVSWSGLACFFLSVAVELWASNVEEDLADALESNDD